VGLLIQLTALGVAADVDRKNHLGGKLAGLLQHRVDRLRIGVGMLRHGLEFIGDLEQLVHHKLHVAQGRVVDGHGELLWRK